MTAVQAAEHGDVSVLRSCEVALPEPGLYDVLARVHAIGVSRLDCEVRSGVPEVTELCGTRMGWSVAGTAVRTGGKIGHVDVGDRVYGLVGFASRGGGYADFALLPTETVLRIPEAVGFSEAAAVPLAAMVAYQALFDVARLRSKQRVLVTAGAGAIGHFAVQMAAAAGASVSALASERNHAFLRSLGADEVAEHQAAHLQSALSQCDVVIDSVGGQMTALGLRVLSRSGTLVSLSKGGRDPHVALSLSTRRLQRHSLRPRRATLHAVSEMIEQGRLWPTVMEVDGLPELRHAHTLSESGHARGCIVCRLR
jgi:NADPH2:quinone reductase